MKEELNWDQEIKKKLGAISGKESPNWNVMSGLLDECLPLTGDLNFDHQVKGHLEKLEYSTDSKWTRMKEMLDQEGLGYEAFDQDIAAKILSFTPQGNSNWDKISQELDGGEPLGKQADLFDRNLRRALGTITLSGKPNWSRMNFALDADGLLGDQERFDENIRVQIEDLQTANQSGSRWLGLQDRMDLLQDRSRRIIGSKAMEIAFILLLLFSFPYLFRVAPVAPSLESIKEDGTSEILAEVQESNSEAVNLEIDKLTEKEEFSSLAFSNSIESSTNQTTQAANGSDIKPANQDFSGSLRHAETKATEASIPFQRASVLNQEQDISISSSPTITTRLLSEILSNTEYPEMDLLASLNLADNEDRSANLWLPIVGVDQGFKHIEVRIQRFTDGEKIIYKNIYQPGIALGLSNGMIDFETGLSRFEFQHNGLGDSEFTFRDDASTNRRYKRTYDHAEFEAWVIPVQSRVHLPIENRFDLHVLLGVQATYLTKADNAYFEEYEGPLDPDIPIGGGSNADLVLEEGSDFLLNATLGLGLNYKLSDRCMVLFEGLAFQGINRQSVGQNGDEWSSYGLNAGIRYRFVK